MYLTTLLFAKLFAVERDRTEACIVTRNNYVVVFDGSYLDKRATTSWLLHTNLTQHSQPPNSSFLFEVKIYFTLQRFYNHFARVRFPRVYASARESVSGKLQSLLAGARAEVEGWNTCQVCLCELASGSCLRGIKWACFRRDGGFVVLKTKAISTLAWPCCENKFVNR